MVCLAFCLVAFAMFCLWVLCRAGLLVFGLVDCCVCDCVGLEVLVLLVIVVARCWLDSVIGYGCLFGYYGLLLFVCCLLQFAYVNSVGRWVLCAYLPCIVFCCICCFGLLLFG